MEREYIVQGHYGPQHGWEDLAAESTMDMAVNTRIVYDEAEPGTRHRVVSRKVES